MIGTGSSLGDGFVLAAIPMLIAGLFFAVALSRSEYIAIVGKSFGWPLSFMLGSMGGVHWADSLIPDAGPVGPFLMFGPGFFFTWMFVGLVFHEDMMEREFQFLRWAYRRTQKAIENRQIDRQAKRPSKRYKNFADISEPEDQQ